MLGPMKSSSLVDICEAGKEQESWALECVLELQENYTSGVRGALGACVGLLLSLGVRGESIGCGLCGPKPQPGLEMRKTENPQTAVRPAVWFPQCF